MKISFSSVAKRSVHVTVLAVLLLFGTNSRVLAAVDPADSQCSPQMSVLDCNALTNNWVNWVPDDGSGNTSCSASGSTTLVGSTNEEKIWNFLIGKGLTAVQAAGVMGNMAVESAHTWSPAVHQATGDPWNSVYGNGFGLVQWDGGRRYTAPEKGVLGSLKKNQPDLVPYADEKYNPYKAVNPSPVPLPADVENSMLAFELNYLYNESTSRTVTYTALGKADNEWDTLKLQNTIENATVFWHNNFEVSSDSAQAVIQNRGGDAKDVYNTYGKNGTSGSTTSIGLCADTSGFAQTVVAFAWPTYHPPTYLDREPAYAQAIDKSEKNGLYVGDNHGIDCGGFVTTLMLYSGFEPKYNYSGKGGNTTTQEAWMEKNWTFLGNSASINTADLRPGDVAINSEHTFVWVGKIDGFHDKIASASTGSGYQRAPMSDSQQVPTDPGYHWYRKK